ncbi:MAG: hypothetical protein FWC72_00460 [Oscillospiraceae bacterium]|nr:hypothetical protein [Oscillospiraceae bacterium]
MKIRIISVLLLLSMALSILVGCNNAQRAIPPAEAAFETIELYTRGSNQEWALWALSQLENSGEKIRLYEFLMRAHSFLMVYDLHDYLAEYNEVKSQWTDALPDFDEESRESIELMLDDEHWGVDIVFPLDAAFQLTMEEFLSVYFYFTDANPQFFLNLIVPGVRHDEDGLVPYITLPAYYVFADRRQAAYHNVLEMFADFAQTMSQSVDMTDEFAVVRYVYSYVVHALSYNWTFEEYVPLARIVNDTTILGFFGETRLTQCKGYATIITYLLNRLGVNAIDQGGSMIERDASGEIINLIPHAWNLVMLEGQWYFLDATWETPGEYHWFLRGRGEHNDSYFLHWHAIAEDMLYPEAAIDDFVFPVRR